MHHEYAETVLSIPTPAHQMFDRGQTDRSRLTLRTGAGKDETNRRSTRHRLPWLDGERSRPDSLQFLPGSFLDDSQLERFPAENINMSPKVKTSSEPSPTSPVDDRTEQHRNEMSFAKFSPTVGAFPITRAGTLEIEIPSTQPLSTGSAGEIAFRAVTQSPVEDKPTIPAPSLADLARKLRPTDSSRLTNSETSSSNQEKGDSERFSDAGEGRAPKRTPSPASPLTILPVVERHLSNPSPLSIPKDLAAGIAGERRVSLTVQPIRRKSTIASTEHLPVAASISDRRPSMDLQPIKGRKGTLKQLDTLAEEPLQKKKSVTSSGTAEDYALVIRSSIAGIENLMQETMKLAKEAERLDRGHEAVDLVDDANIALRDSVSIIDPHQIPASEASSVTSDSESDSSASSRGSTLIFDSHPRSPSVTLPEAVVVLEKNQPLNPPPSIPEHLPQIPTELFESEPSLGHSRETTAHDWAYSSQNQAEIEDLSIPPRYRRKGPGRPIQRTVTFSNDPQGAVIVNNEPAATVSSIRLVQNSAPLPALEGTMSPEIVAQAALSTSDAEGNIVRQGPSGQSQNWGRDKHNPEDYATSDALRNSHHVTLREGQRFSLRRGYRRQPVARNWSNFRKRWTAIVACLNTALIGLLVGIYAGEVPAIQYAIADQHHRVILGNVVLYLGMGLTTLVAWPLPLLHGRKPYTLVAFAVALPLQFPQAVVVNTQRDPNYAGYRVGLLLSRTFQGLFLGLAHINSISTLLDLFGASLQSLKPHGELVIVDDIRRHGGGMGLWLGFWSFCFIAAIALGFMVGADVISGLNPAWGFYISVILIAVILCLNLITPETRRAPHRRTLQEVELPNEQISRRIARGEIKMHVSGDGPKWWWEEVFAGLYLSTRMIIQTGFLVIALYVAWIYAEIVLVIVLLGNLLSAGYRWRPEYVGLGVFAIFVGAALAIPLSRANVFSRARSLPQRTDSMTYQPRLTWSSHLIRRALFMVSLPVAGIAYTLASGGVDTQYMVPIIFAGLIGFISNLAISECNGIIMETFDTSDLQPGANSRHRLQSLPPAQSRRRTTYSSYPRVSAGIFASQALGFFFAAAATGVGGAVTRAVGAQRATAITAGILLGLTILLICALWRFRSVQVIPNELFGHYFGSLGAEKRRSTASMRSDRSWRAVIIGNPSGKMRRMSWLELGSLSRWTEIRRLNRLLSRATTQPLNPGWR